MLETITVIILFDSQIAHIRPRGPGPLSDRGPHPASASLPRAQPDVSGHPALAVRSAISARSPVPLSENEI